MNHVTYRTILKTGPWYENYQIVYMSCLYGIVKKNKKINCVSKLLPASKTEGQKDVLNYHVLN